MEDREIKYCFNVIYPNFILNEKFLDEIKTGSDIESLIGFEIFCPECGKKINLTKNRIRNFKQTLENRKCPTLICSSECGSKFSKKLLKLKKQKQKDSISENDKYILAAMVLGDGSLTKVKDHYILQISHCELQKEYLIKKANRISQILNKKININTLKKVEYSKEPYINRKKVKQYGISVSHPIFEDIYNEMYLPKKKVTLKLLNNFSDEGIGYWYMDDGSLYAKKKEGKVYAYELVISICGTKGEAEEAILFFNNRYNIKFSIKKDKQFFSIRCATKQIRRLIPILNSNISKDMEYKFIDCITDKELIKNRLSRLQNA